MAAILMALVFGIGRPANAHEFRPAVLALEETAPDEFAVQWRPPRDGLRRDLELEPSFPAGCHRTGRTLSCSDSGLSGELTVRGLSELDAEVVVRIAWLDGRRETRVLRPDAPSMEVGGGSSAARVALDYTRLGVEHILGGIDHLLFVLGLLLLVGFERRLLWTVTGFTLAHSLTLAGSVLGLVSLPQAPVEAVIALSILLVAVEVGRDEPSLSRAHPAWVAFGFGLLHGFGFSGALQEIGLPEGQLPIALLTFNVGVELGQLAVIGGAFAVWWLAVSRVPERHRPTLVTVGAYGLGTIATFWTIDRVLGFWW